MRQLARLPVCSDLRNGHGLRGLESLLPASTQTIGQVVGAHLDSSMARPALDWAVGVSNHHHAASTTRPTH